jgi:hypothetical protein
MMNAKVWGRDRGALVTVALLLLSSNLLSPGVEAAKKKKVVAPKFPVSDAKVLVDGLGLEVVQQLPKTDNPFQLVWAPDGSVSESAEELSKLFVRCSLTDPCSSRFCAGHPGGWDWISLPL